MKKMIVKVKTWFFERRFNSVYEGLLKNGENTNVKIRLIRELKANKTKMLATYLNGGDGFNKQFKELKTTLGITKT